MINVNAKQFTEGIQTNTLQSNPPVKIYKQMQNTLKSC
jgi:hypothetical protein